MKIFLAGTSFRADYGGPAVSVTALAAALARVGSQVGLWAPDQSADTADHLSSDSRVQRLRGSAGEALDEFGRPDIIHDNGLWLPHNHQLADRALRQRVPRVVSTRGMLEPWAVRHKRWKKALAWRLYQRRDLRCAALHHVTSDVEAANLQRAALGPPVRMIPNGVELPPKGMARRTGPTRTALFLGRIYPVKGLPDLVEAWGRVRPEGWRLCIAGPDEAGHQAQVERIVASTSLEDLVSFPGSLDTEAKATAFAEADLLVLPSRSESFGMAVAEALAHGVPVLTTTAVPWPMLELLGCGWRVAPDVEGLSEGLRLATAADDAARRAMGARGRELVAADYGWDGIARRFLDAYAELTA